MISTAEQLGNLFDDPEVTEDTDEEFTSGSFSLAQYLREIKDIPIPDPTEVHQLAQIIQGGKNAQDVLETLEFAEIPIEGEVMQILARVEAGKIAEARLFIGHLRLAAHVARLTMGWVPWGQDRVKPGGESIFKGAIFKDLSQFASAPMPIEDRIQAANLGLMKAVRKYRTDGGALFTTFAMYDIEQSIARAIQDDGTIRVPQNVQDERTRALKRGSLEDIRYQSISGDRYLIWRHEDVHHAVGEMLRGLVHIDEVDEAELVAENEDFFDSAETRMREEALRAALDKLNERQRFVVEMHYGLVDGEEHTFAEIGQILGVTRESARNIEERALGRLQNEELYGMISEYASPRRELLGRIKNNLYMARQAEHNAGSWVEREERDYEKLNRQVSNQQHLTYWQRNEGFEELKRQRDQAATHLQFARHEQRILRCSRVLSEKALAYAHRNAYLVDLEELPSVDSDSIGAFIKRNCRAEDRGQIVQLLDERLNGKFDKVNRQIELMEDKDIFWRWLKSEIDNIVAEIHPASQQ